MQIKDFKSSDFHYAFILSVECLSSIRANVLIFNRLE